MILKLDHNQDRFLERTSLVNKINELIDAVNVLEEKLAAKKK